MGEVAELKKEDIFKSETRVSNPWLDPKFNKVDDLGGEPGFKVDDIPERLGLVQQGFDPTSPAYYFTDLEDTPKNYGTKLQFVQTDGKGKLSWAWPFWSKAGSTVYYKSGKVAIGHAAARTVLHVLTPTASEVRIETSGASDPTLSLKTTNTAHQVNLALDESAVADHVDFIGQTASVDTLFHVIGQAGQTAKVGVQIGSYRGEFICGPAGAVSLKNITADLDLVFGIKDGAVNKTITWDADVDKLKHSHGTFDFDDDDIQTLGTGRFDDLHLNDTNASHIAIIHWNEDEAGANRTLNFTLSGGNRTFALHGNLTVEAASLVNQDLTSDSTVAQFAKLTVTADDAIEASGADARFLFSGAAGGIGYEDGGATARWMLYHAGSNVVQLCNRAANGVVYIKANTSTAGLAGEVTVATFEDDLVTLAVDLRLSSNKELRFYDNGNYVGFEAPALSANQIWVLPSADGPANEVLGTDNSGNLVWRTHDELAGFVSSEHLAALDEDNMVSNSDTNVATQQSIKAYVDTEISGASFQPLDNTLTALAGLNTSADKYIRVTGVDTFDLRTYANVLSDIGAAAASHAMSTHSDEDTYNISTSGTLTAGNAILGTIGCGVLTSGNIIIPSAGYIGSVGDADAIQIEAGGDILFTQKLGFGITPNSAIHIQKTDATVYNDTADGQPGDTTIQIYGLSTTTNTFAQILFKTRSSNMGLARIVAISPGGSTTDLAFITESGSPSEKMRITHLGSLGLGTSIFGANATKTFAQNTGVAPTTSPADCFQMYSADIAAGEAAPHFMTEHGDVIKLYQQAHIADAPGDTAANNATTINAILTTLENAGLLATA